MALYQIEKDSGGIPTGNLSLVAGGTLFEDIPVASEIKFDGANIPSSFLVCDGSTFSATDYPELAEALGGTTLPTNSGYIIKAKYQPIPESFLAKVDEVVSDMFLVVNDAIDATGTLTANQDLRINMPTPPSGYKYFCCDFKGTGNNSVSPRAWASDAVYIHNNSNTSQSYDITVNITYMKSN